MSDIREVKNLLKDAQENGFEVKHCSSGVIKIYAKNTGVFYTMHPGKRALHPFRRFLKKNI